MSMKGNKFFSAINDWHQSLNPAVQAQLLQVPVEQLKECLFDLFEALDLKSEISAFWTVLKDTLKRHSVEETVSLLCDEGFQSKELLDLMAQAARSELEIYFDSEALRECGMEHYTAAVETIIRDIYAHRKYRYHMSLLTKNLPFFSDVDTKKIVYIIYHLLNATYMNNLSFEHTRKVMVQEMDLNGDKIDRFFEILEQYREKVETYFLFEQLSQMRSTVMEIKGYFDMLQESDEDEEEEQPVF